MMPKYTNFLRLARELVDINHAQGLLSWDQETNMPPCGAEPRARSVGLLAGLYHEKLTSKPFVNLVDELTAMNLDDDATVNVREIKREQDRALKIPQKIVVELSEAQSLSHEAWVEARKTSDFGRFSPWLKNILELKNKVADLIGYEGSKYNVFLEEFEPNTRVEDIQPILSELRERLKPLVENILAIETPKPELLTAAFPVTGQEAFGREVLADLGFNSEAGRLDVSVHPFCSSLAPTDVRLTTRYSANQMSESLFGIIHECGHGLYEQGLPADAVGTPLCQAVSLGIHESQSRLWENMIGRSCEFWEYYLPKLKNYFPEQLRGVELEYFYSAINHVEASPIRVEADEVTYNLHILLRFELEQRLVEGSLDVDQLPEYWNETMEDYLGIHPGNHALGVLQDIHWSSGLIGYFPTYTLGNLYAAQLFNCARETIPGLMGKIRNGEFGILLTWLRENIHGRGRRLCATELIEEVTGSPLSTDSLMGYLEEKYNHLYSL